MFYYSNILKDNADFNLSEQSMCMPGLSSNFNEIFKCLVIL